MAPKTLSPVARKAWAEVCDILYKLGVLTGADGPAVEGLTECYAELRAARSALAARGSLTYETLGGIWKSWPEVAIVSDTDKRFRNWLGAFGLSPADRSRVTTVPKDEREDFSEFLN